jgi:hypothetical protein
MTKVKKEKKPPVEYWQDFVSLYFEFTKSRLKDVPTFDGSAPRDLKTIILALKKRADDAGVEWTQEIALFRFKTFLELAFSDWWLSENWMLSNINRQKDKVFFKAAKNKQ